MDELYLLVILQGGILWLEELGKIWRKLKRILNVARKKFVRYQEGAELYSIGLHTFQSIAKDEGAVYKVKGVTLVNVEIVDEYLELFRVE